MAGFIGIGLVGVVLLLAGLSWDAVMHARDPGLAAREGLVALGNPGHLMLGGGMFLVVASLVGAAYKSLSQSSNPRFRRPGLRRALLGAGAALALSSATVTSWASGASHEGAHTAGMAHQKGDGAAHQDGTAHQDDAGPAGDHHRGAGEAALVATAEPQGAAGAHAHDPAMPHGPAETARAADPAHGEAGHAHDPATSHGGLAHSSAGAAAAAPPRETHEHSSAGGSPSHQPAAGASDGGGHQHPAGPGHDPGSPGAGGGSPVEGLATSVRWGPFVLPPGELGRVDYANVLLSGMQKPCENCYILGFEPDVVYADGRRANFDTGVMLHHAVMFAQGRPDTTCSASPFFDRLGERFFASGNERTGGLLPSGFGYHVGPEAWNGLFHIMNHSETTQTVFFSLSVRYLPDSAQNVRPVTPVWLDVNNCQTSEYAVPAGKSSTHWTWTSTITGRILGTGGHVHDGGVATVLRNTTTGQHICTSAAGYGKDPAFMGTIESMSTCTWDAVGTVRAGEVLDLEAIYDASAPVSDAMGIMLAYVYQTDDLAGGTAPPEGLRDGPPQSTPPPVGEHGHGGDGHTH